MNVNVKLYMYTQGDCDSLWKRDNRKENYLKLKDEPVCMGACIEINLWKINHTFAIKIILTKEIMIPDSHSKLCLCYVRLLQLEREDLIEYRVECLGLVSSLFPSFPFPEYKKKSKK